MNTKSKVQTIYRKMEWSVCYLHDRWLDEKEYEDWNEYAERMKNDFVGIIEDAKFVKATKRPFGFQFDVDGVRFQMSATSTKLHIKLIKEL